MIRRPPRSTPLYSSAASDVYKRQVQGGGRARLAMEALHELLVVGEALAQDLHRHEPPQRRVSRKEDLSHAAAAQPSLDPVAAGDQPALRRGGSIGRRRRRARGGGSVAGSFAVWIVRGQTEHLVGESSWTSVAPATARNPAAGGRLRLMAV